MHRSNNSPPTLRLRPALTLTERNDKVRVEYGTIIVTTQWLYACGSARLLELRVGNADIALAQHHEMRFPIDADEKQLHHAATDISLAKYLRLIATPMLMTPERGLEKRIDRMVALAAQHLLPATARLN